MWDDELDSAVSSQNSWSNSTRSNNFESTNQSTWRGGNQRSSNGRRDYENSGNQEQQYQKKEIYSKTFSATKRYDRGPRNDSAQSQNWRSGEEENNRDRNRGGRNSEWRDRNEPDQRFDQSSRSSGGNSVQFSINSSKVGLVIGKRGAKINEFCEKSGAKIQVDSNNTNEYDEVQVTATGSEEACVKAKELIEEFIEGFGNMELRDNSRNFSSSYSQPNYGRSNNSQGNYGSSSNSQGNYGSSSNSQTYRNSNSSHTNYGNNDTTESSESNNEPFDWDYFKKMAEEHEKVKFLGLPPIIKAFYDEQPEVASCSKATVAKLRAERNSITVQKGEDNPIPISNPVWKFEQAFMKHPEILSELKKQGFTEPSPIQCQAWPVLLQGHDMIGIAQTGTGKTIAFLLPALIHIEHQPTPRAQRVGPTCLILAPTRELAQQIYNEALKYSYRNIKCVCVYGGGSRRDQIKVVSKGVEIVIATPGRLVDLIKSEIIELKGVSYMVLDEADRMLDMGFEPDVKYIMSYIRPDRQTVLTSATWPEGVARLVNKYMKNPITVNVGSLDLTAVHTVEQQFYFVSDYDQKRDLVFNFIENMEPEDKVIIFVDRKAVVDDVASDIQLNGIHCASLHGDRCQEDREQALQEFKDSQTRILVATDLASRGLDVKDITHVFNMVMPKNLEDYVHRIGRTGRAGRNGISITLIDRQDWGIARKLIAILEESGNYVPPELIGMADRYEKKKQEQQLAGGPSRGFRGRRY